MWFKMTKVVRIGINQGTLLVWILNSCCLDHNDVTWDGYKEGNSREQEERKMKQGVGFFLD
jgi:hypothetical protein